MSNTTTRIAIIGGGAAGLMCAATLQESDQELEIHLYEKNPYLGAKVIISGGGRCNVTTGITDKKTLLSKYTRGSQFLKSAIGQFPPEKVQAWFEEQGIQLKTEDDMRVFPVSNDGKEVVKVFERLFENNKVMVHLKEQVMSIHPNDDGTCQIVTKTSEKTVDYVVITTGGNAYQHTGSTGDGYAFSRAFGHSITPLGPSLNSFLCHENWPKNLSGIALENALLSSKTDTGEKVSTEGPMLFTHFGISGPATFALSSHLAFSTISEEQSKEVFIRPYAKRNAHEWNSILLEHFETHRAQQLQKALKIHFPQRLVQVLFSQADINPEKPNSEVSKKERLRLSELLGGQLKVSLSKRRPGDEFVTAGGVELSEIDKKTMQSKRHPALFFGGEIMNVDGVTGGFNLQASWATGRLAAQSILKTLQTSS